MTQQPDVTIDPLAAVHPAAELGPGTTVDAFAFVGAAVRIGARCRVLPHAVILGPCELGDDNVVYPFACLGGEPQDLRHRGEATRLVVGHGNTFREQVTVSRGTIHGGGVTRIGDHNLLMASCHVAHDCQLGDHVVMANHATLAGHVRVESHAVFGGLAAIGAFLRVGESAMVAAGAMVERDVPPFLLVAGDRATLRAVNRVGLKRRGFSSEACREIKRTFLALRDRGTPLVEIVATARRLVVTPEARQLVEFLARAERGVTR